MSPAPSAGYPVTAVIGGESPRPSQKGKLADDFYMAGYNAALDAAECAGVAIMQGTWGNVIRREHAAAGLLHFTDAAREALRQLNATHVSQFDCHAAVVTRPKVDRIHARQAGFTGDTCDTCGSLSMKRVGSCLTCDACGTTTGCS